MSDGKSHSSASIGLGVGVLTGLLPLYPKEIVAVSLGALLGVVLTPDLDVDNGSISNWYVRKIFGKFGDRVWRMWTTPYAYAMSHRSTLSHFPGISTIVRLLYLAFPIIIIIASKEDTFLRAVLAQLIAIPLLIALTFVYREMDIYYLAFVILGLVLSDTLHYLFDWVF